MALHLHQRIQAHPAIHIGIAGCIPRGAACTSILRLSSTSIHGGGGVNACSRNLRVQVLAVSEDAAAALRGADDDAVRLGTCGGVIGAARLAPAAVLLALGEGVLGQAAQRASAVRVVAGELADPAVAPRDGSDLAR